MALATPNRGSIRAMIVCATRFQTRSILAAGLALFALISPGWAQGAGGDATRSIEPGCRTFLKQTKPASIEEAAYLGKCVGMVEAVLKLAPAVAIVPKPGDKPIRLCAPAGTTVDRVLNVAMKTLDEHEEYRSLPFLPLIINSIVKTWPCPS